MRNIFLFAVISILLVACSEAALEGYGPRNQGLIGGAYGYSDRKISGNTFYVDYVGATGYATDARENAKRRATELCFENGFARAEYNPQIRNQGVLVIASGNAKCLGAGEKFKQLTEKQRIERRIAEIDAEIASYNARDARDSVKKQYVNQPILSGIDALVSGIQSRSDKNNIAKLQQEREKLIRKLQSL